jgi:hypothetical protein
MSVQPPLADLLGARWALGSAVGVVAWSGECAAFALADGTVALASVPWSGAPTLRRREEGGVEVVPARGAPPPLARASVSRGPCLALAGVAGGFLTGGADGRLRRLALDGTAEKVAKFEGAVNAVVATGPGWACIAGGRAYEGPVENVRDLPHATGLAWHETAGLAVSHAGGVALRRGEQVEQLPGEAPGTAVIAFSPDGRWLAGPALWRLSPPARVALPGAPELPAAAAFSADGSLLALAGPDGARLWHLEGEAPALGAWQGGSRAASALAFHPRHALLAAAYANGVVMLGPASGRDMLLLRGAADAISALAFDTSGAWLAIGTAEGGCEIIALPDLLFRGGEAQPANHSEGTAA